MDDIFELQEFFVEGGQQETSHVLLHITEPSTPEEKLKGYFFAVAEMNHGGIDQVRYLQQMIDDLESGYYATDETPKDTKDTFEMALEYINRRSHHILSHPPTSLHCVVGILRGRTLRFASHGQPEVKLFYRVKGGEVAWMDPTESPEPGVGGEQLFPSVMEGELHAGDYLYLATPHVREYFSADRVEKLITSRRAKESATHIQKTLAGLRSAYSYGGIVFHLYDPAQVPHSGEVPKSLTPQKGGSLHHLIAQQDATRATLAPSWWKKVLHGFTLFSQKKGGRVKRPSPPLPETNYRPRPTRHQEPLNHAILIGMGRALVTLTRGVFVTIKKTGVFLGKIMIGLILVATNKGGQRELVFTAGKTWIRERKKQLAHLPLGTKILLTLTVLVSLFFVGGISSLRWKEERQTREQVYLNLVEEVRRKVNDIEATRLYGDENRAFALAQESQTALTQLPADTERQRSDKQALYTLLETHLQSLRKLRVVTPEIVNRLTDLQPTADATNLARIGDFLLAYGPDDSLVYTIHKETKAVETKEHPTIPKLNADSTPKEQDVVVFLSGEQGLAIYDPKRGVLVNKEIELPEKSSALRSLVVYNQRLYTLDAKNSQIYRHQKTQTGYDKGTPWVQGSPGDLHDAVSLAVDGDVYVLKQNGTIIKFSTGIAVPFEITNLDPVLQEPSLLWTHNTVEYLYILEPTQKRVVVLTKDGRLVQQYTADSWQRPTGMVVDEERKTVYILDQNTVYQFGL